MSRTYRIRNLPRLTAKKYVDGNGGWNYKRRDARLRKLREKYYPEYGGKHRWSSPYYSIIYNIEHMLERQFPNSVETAHAHPWVSWCLVGHSKKEYKNRGNRWGRRQTKAIISQMSYDDDYDNRRNFPTRRQEFWDIWDIC